MVKKVKKMAVIINDSVYELDNQEIIGNIESNSIIEGISLSYFDSLIGPSQFYSSIKEELAGKIVNLIDIELGDKVFLYGIENYMVFNKSFSINSNWARGKVESLMISVVIDEKNFSIELKEYISNYIDNAIKMLNSDENMYKGFYVSKNPKYANEDEVNLEEIQLQYEEILYRLRTLSRFLISIKNF
jgi:hypothetical protein